MNEREKSINKCERKLNRLKLIKELENTKSNRKNINTRIYYRNK